MQYSIVNFHTTSMRMNTFKKLNNLLGWLVFAIATTVYLLTSEPTASFWDCGEYIATAFKLQVGHPPGAPLFQMLGRFFSLFAFGNTAMVARMINGMSALASGFTILFLFWTITLLARKIIKPKKEEGLNTAQQIAVFGSAFVGAMAYTFSDSFWFSAVEGEVYAMSSFFTAIVFWAILKWEEAAEQAHAFRWIILIAYLMGLSVGVHLLSLLTIPALFFVYYFKMYQPHWKGVLLTGILSILTLAFIQIGIIPEVVSLFAKTELTFVNRFHLPFNSGTIFMALALISWIVSGIRFTHHFTNEKAKKTFLVCSGIMALLLLNASASAGSFIFRLLVIGALVLLFYVLRQKPATINSIILAIAFILLGYSSFLMLVIRSNAGTPINENSPKNAISLLAYLNREQYGDWPLLHGQYFNAPVVDNEDGTPVYEKNTEKGKYTIKDANKGDVPVFDPRFTTLFPRMWSGQMPYHADYYKRWGKIQGTPITVSRPGSKAETLYKPTFRENLRFFFNYQINHMYIRYFMWNFAGRQNDLQGRGEILNGNWISGIPFLDTLRLGPQNIPESMTNKAHNKFYLLPLLLGLVGLLYQIRKAPGDGAVTALLFLMTGLAIILYINQMAPQPRERDYAYVGSFYAFAIWIGLGVMALIESLDRLPFKKGVAIASTLIALILVPGIMAAEGWDDHDRSNRYTSLAIAKNYLNSCAPNAVLFTNGDNDTFPLWYAQEVEGIRTDIRVVNLSLLNADWYINQLKYKMYDSDPLPLSLDYEEYKDGTRDYVIFGNNNNEERYYDLTEVFRVIKEQPKRLQMSTQMGSIDYIPTQNFVIRADPATVIANGTVPAELAAEIEPIAWQINKSGIGKSGLIMLDFLAHNNWERPVYFAITTGSDVYLGLEDFFQLEGLTYRLLPIRTAQSKTGAGRINSDILYTNLMEKFEFGNMNQSNVFLDETNIRMTNNLRGQFNRLADQLIQEGKKQEAIDVLDRCLAEMPHSTVTYNQYMLYIAGSYMEAGAIEKGTAILNKLLDLQSENLRFYFDFPKKKRKLLERDIQQSIAIASSIGQLAGLHQVKSLSEKAEQTFSLYYQEYINLMRN